MLTQVYKLNTIFNFGKHKGKTLKNILDSGEGRYVGYLIVSGVKRFVLHPDTVKELEHCGFFDDMPISYYGSCGFISTKGIVGCPKSEILEMLQSQYDEFIKNPGGYEATVEKEQLAYFKGKT